MDVAQPDKKTLDKTKRRIKLDILIFLSLYVMTETEFLAQERKICAPGQVQNIYTQNKSQ